MPDLKQALRDFVATSNSGKYADEKTLLSKFPELKGYDIQVLRDFVATSNSGKYASEDEVFAKFPEFNLGGPEPVKKKVTTGLPLVGGSSAPAKSPDIFASKEALAPKAVKPEPKPAAPAPAPEKKDDGQGWFLNTVSALDRGFYKNLIGNPIKGLGTILQGGTAKVLGGTGKGFVSEALINFGDYFNNAIDEIAPQDEEFKGTLSDDFAQAFGQVASLVLTGSLGGATSRTATALPKVAPTVVAGVAPTAAKAAAGTGAAAKAIIKKGAEEAVKRAAPAIAAGKGLASQLASPVAISSGLSIGQAEFDRAKQAGATDDQAFEAFYKNAIVGSVLEKIPVMQFLKRFNKASAGGVVNYLKTKTVAGITGGLEEMSTEVFQQLYANKTAQEIYNINQSIFEGVGESGGIGFGVGFLLNAMGANARILRQQGKNEEAQVIEDQIKDLETQAQRGGPSSYTFNGIKIQPMQTEEGMRDPREVVSEMIDNMTAADLAKANIEITNDPELRIKLQEKIVTSSIKEQAREANPSLSEEQLDEITNLEKELRKLEGNTTQLGKDRAAQIRSQIKTIQDAVQKQAAGEVPVQPKAGVGEEVAKGEPQAKPEVAPEEGAKKEVKLVNAQGAPITNKDQIKANSDFLESSIADIKSAEQADQVLRSAGVVVPADAKESFNKFIQDRIDGKTTMTLEQWAEAVTPVAPAAPAPTAPTPAAPVVEAVPAPTPTAPIAEGEPAAPVAVATPVPTTEAVVEEEAPFGETASTEPVAVREEKNLMRRALNVEALSPRAEVLQYFIGGGKINPEALTEFFGKERRMGTGKINVEERRSRTSLTNKNAPSIEALAEKIAGTDRLDQVQEYREAIEDALANHSGTRTMAEELVRDFDADFAETKRAAQLQEMGKAIEEETKAFVSQIPKEQQEEILKVLDRFRDDQGFIDWRRIDQQIEEGFDPVLLELSEPSQKIINDAIKQFQETGRVGSVTPEVTVKEETLDDLLQIDEKDPTGIEKALKFIEKIDSDLDKFGRETMGINLALPVVRAVVKTVKALLRAGVSLQNAIARAAAENNVSDQDVIDAIKFVAEEAPRKAAPSAKKILGQAREKVTVDEMAALKSQIRLEARAAREAKKDLNTKRKQLSDAVRKMGDTGMLSVKKVNAIVNRIGKVNLDSQMAVDKFLNYAERVFADAEYAEKLGDANKSRKQIKKLSKSKEKAANLRDLGSKFADIDPAMVEDIDRYNEIAGQIKEAIRGSSIRDEVKFAEMVKEADVIGYINDAIENQDKILFDMKVAEVQELLGIDGSNLTYDQLVELLNENKEAIDKNEDAIKEAVDNAFKTYSDMIKESIITGKDPFTGEDVEYTEKQKKVAREFAEMDPKLLDAKEALRAVDSMLNFLQNQSIAKMDAVVSEYKGKNGIKEINRKGIKSRAISKYWSKGLGRFLIEQTANLNILFERVFGGFTNGGIVENLMGVTALKNGKSSAQSESNKIVKRYFDSFYKKKPNNQAFNTANNNTERGMVAFMMRNVIGTDAEMQAEFGRRKKLIEESIDFLSQGNDKEVAKAKVYQEVYDKVLADANTIDDVVSKADPINVEAVKFWQNEWNEKYDELSDVALGVYNKVLGKDINYNPDRYTRLSSDTGDLDLSTDEMAFIFNSGNAPIYKKETGVLMTATRPESLPRSEKDGQVNRYVDLSFDANNSNSMYDALVDIKTAAPIRQVEAAMRSPEFRKLIPDSDDRRLLENRIKLYVNNTRNKNPFSNDEFSKGIKSLNRLATIGVGQALGGVLQPIKQTVPIVMNTLINAGSFDIRSVTDRAKQNFINNSGYAIANRGVESQAQVESLNKMINQAAETKGEKLFRAIEKINDFYLKNFLVKADAAVARASWMTYYEQSLKKQGIDPNTIDYNTHQINEEAADYAQRQVDRQQNVSDSDLTGALLSSKSPERQLIVKTLMPFASFRMNQSARLGADIATLTDDMSTKEDKIVAIRSLAGFAAEQATFRIISAGAALLISAIAKEKLGREDDEKDKKKTKDAIIKGQLTSTVADVLSPIPVLDKAVQSGVSTVLDAAQNAMDIKDEEKINIYSGKDQTALQSLGLFGIALGRIDQVVEMSRLASGAPFKDQFGRKKYLSKDDREAIGELVPLAILSGVGLAPSEVNSIARTALADAKRKSSTKEGGKTKEDIKLEKREEALAEQGRETKEETKVEKLDALKELRDMESDDDRLKVINDMIEDIEMTDEEKEKMSTEKKRQRIEEREEEQRLLEGYKNRTEMKKKDPALYKENFGKQSDYYQKNKAKMEVKRKLSKLMNEPED